MTDSPPVVTLWGDPLPAQDSNARWKSDAAVADALDTLADSGKIVGFVVMAVTENGYHCVRYWTDSPLLGSRMLTGLATEAIREALVIDRSVGEAFAERGF